jgi:excisionase family DNA binding protein
VLHASRAPVRAVPEELLTVREVAARLRLSTATVYKLCTRGDLPHVRILNSIRVTPSGLNAFLARR